MVLRISPECPLSMWLLLLLPFVAAGPSQRGKCALECFVRCMQSGTSSPAQCNCPVERVSRRCSSVEAKLLKAEIIADIPEVHTEYMDSHTIRIQMAPLPAAFAYIFEYSTISTQPDDWYFAGASTNPTVTFTVLDACRDYQFRVIVVVRSTDPEEQMIIFRPRAVPVNLPPFSLNPAQISVDIPPRNVTLTDTLKVYVRWSLPRGYSDGDIYGYEAPALYPIQCHTPEEELPQPKIEIMRSGGRLSITLPSSVLEARCRLWAEVRMLPRCVRLEPHSIQKNIEIDCEKTPSIEICSKDVNPICTEAVEINGDNGKAMLTWTSPNPDMKPLYYHLRYGPAQMKVNSAFMHRSLKGSPPFVTWQLATKKDVKVDGSVTSIEVEVNEDEDYGVQVCAIITPHRKKAKFGLVRVTPFQCTSCNVQSSLSVGSCGHCGIIEGTTVMEKSWNKRPPSRTTSDEESQEQQATPHTVFNIGTDLMVRQENNFKKSKSLARTHAQHSAGASGKIPPGPLPIERAEEINRGETLPTVTPLTPEVPSTTPLSTTTTEVTTTTEEILELPETTPPVPTVPPKTAAKELAAKIVEVGTEIHPVQKEQVNNTTITDAFEKLKAGLRGELASLNTKLHEPSEEKKGEKVKPQHQIVTLNTTIESVEPKPESSSLVKAETENVLSTTDPLPKEEEKAVTPRSSIISGKKCLLANGVVCAMGCLSKTTCVCPPETHDLSSNGGCTIKKQKSHHCLSSAILSATWDPVTMNVLVRSDIAAKHLKSAPVKDRLFVEFGRVVDHGQLTFIHEFRQKMVIGTEKLVKAGIFNKEPFIFHVNETIQIDTKSYGMRLCTFDSELIKDAYQFDWDGVDDGEIVAVTQLSTVHFTNDLHGQLDDVYWATVFQVGKVVLLVLLVLIMIGLIYLNCTRIKALYERKRTHYFRPYMVDPQVPNAPGVHRINPAAAGYYDSRRRIA